MTLELANNRKSFETLEVLKRLQLINNKLLQLEHDKEYLLKDIEKKKDSIQTKKAQIAKKQEEIKTFQKEIDSRELDLRSAEEEITKFKTQLLKIKTNKEYSALLTEIRGKEADKSVLEDEILTMMVQLEPMTAEKKALLKELEAEEKELEALSRTVEEELKNNHKEAEEYQRRYKEFSALVEKKALTQYERLIGKDGLAVVAVSNETCKGCFMSITKQTINLLLRKTDLVFCHNCGRILYLEEEAELTQK